MTNKYLRHDTFTSRRSVSCDFAPLSVQCMQSPRSKGTTAVITYVSHLNGSNIGGVFGPARSTKWQLFIHVRMAVPTMC